MQLPFGLETNAIHSKTHRLNLTGRYHLTTIAGRLKNLINHYINVLPVEDSAEFNNREYARFIGQLKDNALIGQFIPGLEISPNTSFDAKVNFDNNQLDCFTHIDNMVYSGIKMTGNDLLLSTANKRLELDFKNQYIIFCHSLLRD